MCLDVLSLLCGGGAKKWASLFDEWVPVSIHSVFWNLCSSGPTSIFFFYQGPQTFKKKLFIVSLILRQQVHLMLKMAYGSCRKWLNSPVSNRKSNSYLLVLFKLCPIHSLAGWSWLLVPHNLGWTYPNTKQGYVGCICDLFLAFCYFPYYISLTFTVLVLFQGGQLEDDQLITVLRMTGCSSDRVTAVTMS